MIRSILYFLFVVCLSSQAWVANDISGVWLNSDQDAHIKIYPSAGKFYGLVVWMKNPIDSTTGKAQLDKLNKDPKLACRPVMNLVVLKDLVFDDPSQEWKDGTVYNPKSGSTYDIFSRMIDKNTLEMNFFVGIRSIGKTVNWIRLDE